MSWVTPGGWVRAWLAIATIGLSLSYIVATAPGRLVDPVTAR